MAQGLNELSSALALRLRDLTRLADRLDRLESGTGRWQASQQAGDWQAAALEISLRALRTAADPTNFSILRFLAAHSSAPIADLEQAAHLGRLALTERINDLVQVGLAGRNIDTDQVQIAAGGAALVGLIDSLGDAAARRLAEMLQPVTR